MDASLLTDKKPVARMKVLELMKRAHFLKLKGKVIMKIDLSNLDHPAHVSRVVDYLVAIVEKMPKHSAVGLVDFRGLRVSDEIKQELVRLTETTSPYFRAGALLASDAQSKEMADVFASCLGAAKLPVYEEEEAAKSWLFAK